MKRVVADTNILVSALQFGGKPKQLLDLAADGQIDLATSEAILAEAARVLGNKFNRTPEWLVEADRQLRVIARIVEPRESLQVIEADRQTIASWSVPLRPTPRRWSAATRTC